jgi:2-polyprenyl-6-methoxyphenol hydroxylase-like FAD-dependent oxidoreductase
MNVLISGAGIAGPTLAYWLAQYGLLATIVEKAAQLRTGGYVVDFWGAGFDVAERMQLVPEIRRRGYAMREVRVVNDAGRRVAGFPAEAFTAATDGRFTSLRRSDLAALIFSRLEGCVETIFGDGIAHIEQTDRCAHVVFESGLTRDFALVIGADGLHSRVRELVWGSEHQFERYLGYKVAAFEVAHYRPRDELTYVMYTEVGQQVARFAMRDDRTLFLLIFADRTADIDVDLGAQKAVLRQRFGTSGWECPRILDALGRVDELYFDRVSQIRMPAISPSWSRHRVALVGDAASCVSLLAGQGTALAMTAAYLLAGEIHRARGDYSIAFARYEDQFRPFVLEKQRLALRFAGAFAPKSTLSMFARNQIMKLLTIAWVARLAIGREFTDTLSLSEY